MPKAKSKEGFVASSTTDEAQTAVAAAGKYGRQVDIVVPPLNWKTIGFEIEGMTPLIVHQFGSKAIKQIQDKQAGKASAGPRKRAVRDPEMDFQESLYKFDDGKRYGVPANAVKASMVRAASLVGGVTMTSARISFFVVGEWSEKSGRELIEIRGSKPAMRTDMVRLSGPGNPADVRYRGQFEKWALRVNIQFNADIISPDHLANLLQRAGHCVGLGEMRPEQNGDTFGRFRLKEGK